MDISVSWFESVGLVLAVEAVAAAMLVMLARRGRRMRPPAIGRVDSDVEREGGFDYTINLVVTIPLLAFLVVFMIEATILLSTKLGTAHAAYAATRSACVWEPYGPAASARKAHQAVALAMAPFSSGLVPPPGIAKPEDRQAANAYVELYHRTVNGPVQPMFLDNQYRRAAAATTVEIKPVSPDAVPKSGSMLSATVTYRYPFRFRVVARVLADGADPASGEAYRTIRTTVWVPRQEVLNDPSVLGPPEQPEP